MSGWSTSCDLRSSGIAQLRDRTSPQREPMTQKPVFGLCKQLSLYLSLKRRQPPPRSSTERAKEEPRRTCPSQVPSLLVTTTCGNSSRKSSCRPRGTVSPHAISNIERKRRTPQAMTNVHPSEYKITNCVTPQGANSYRDETTDMVRR